MREAKKVINVLFVTNDGSEEHLDFLKEHGFMGLPNDSPVLKHNLTGIFIGRNDIIIFNTDDYSINHVIKASDPIEEILEKYYVFEDENTEQPDDDNKNHNCSCANNLDAILLLLNKYIENVEDKKEAVKDIREELNRINKIIK